MMKRAKRPGRRRALDGEPEQVLYHPHPMGPGTVARVGGGEADHALRSLRLRSGDAVVLVDGRGTRFGGTARIVGKELEVTVASREPVPRWPGRTLWLAAGVLRTGRMDILVEKVSELGATRFVPLQLKHCMARPGDHGAKAERWNRIAVESLKQSKRSHLLEIGEVTGLAPFLDALPEKTAVVAADPAGRPPEALEGVTGQPLVLVVGPEGGLAEEERRLLAGRGAIWIALGGNRLRTETAGVALLVAALDRLGELAPGG